MRLYIICTWLIICFISCENHAGDHSQKSKTWISLSLKNSRFAKMIIAQVHYLKTIPGYDVASRSIKVIINYASNMNQLSKIFAAIGCISLIPILLLLAIPLNGAYDCHGMIPRMMLGFAAGCLLGDSFLHIIPHTILSNPEKHVQIGSWIIGGILLFYFIEKLLVIIKGGLSKYVSGNQSLRSQLIEQILRLNVIKAYPPTQIPTSEIKGLGTIDQGNTRENSCVCHRDETQLSTCGILNLIADTVHNFMDGMAIASSFMLSPSTAISTTFSIFFHEVPHEISDYAILLKSGFSPMQAILSQFITAAGAVTGALVAYYLGHSLEIKHSYIVPSLTAGGFIYISCVSIVPEMVAHKSKTLLHSVVEASCMLLGMIVFLIIE